jgi:dihydroorotate dehydrogenase (NAD+) catalytic subunit
LKIPVIVNVAGHTVDDYVAVCECLDAIDCIAGLELNVSCPNVADGLEFGTDPARLASLVAVVKRVVKRATLLVKLTPNTADIAALARAAIDGGAQVLTLINTLRGMAIQVETRKPMLANVTGGLSGPAIKPVALAMVHEVYRRVAQPAKVPLVGMGGIRTWRDAIEFHLAGASAVAVGTALFIDPRSPTMIIDGITDYLSRHGHTRLNEIVGSLRLPSQSESSCPG